MSSLENLPAEVLSQICSYLIPSSQTFLLNSRVPGSPLARSRIDTLISPRYRGTPLVPEDESDPQYPAVVFRDWGVDLFTVLLLHPNIYPRVIECLCSSNTFYLPDLATLLSLREDWSPLVISSVRSIRVDACGVAALNVRGYGHSYSWGKFANLDIVRIPALFPRVRELRLGGVGPGVVYRRHFTYRGSSCFRDSENNDVWTLDNIRLISHITGVGSIDSSDTVAPACVMAGQHALSNGRVFCMGFDQPCTVSPPHGTYRLHGTRIVRRGEAVRLGSMEKEVSDINATRHKARAAHEECETLGCRELSLAGKPS